MAATWIMRFITDSEYRQSIAGVILLAGGCLTGALSLLAILGTFISYCVIGESSVFVRYGPISKTIACNQIKEVKLSNNNTNTVLIYYDKKDKRLCASFTPKENAEAVIERITRSCK
jgi:hypothetical protein